jgi:hypothetical protein
MVGSDTPPPAGQLAERKTAEEVEIHQLRQLRVHGSQRIELDPELRQLVGVPRTVRRSELSPPVTLCETRRRASSPGGGGVVDHQTAHGARRVRQDWQIFVIPAEAGKPRSSPRLRDGTRRQPGVDMSGRSTAHSRPG